MLKQLEIVKRHVFTVVNLHPTTPPLEYPPCSTSHLPVEIVMALDELEHFLKDIEKGKAK